MSVLNQKDSAERGGRSLGLHVFAGLRVSCSVLFDDRTKPGGDDNFLHTSARGGTLLSGGRGKNIGAMIPTRSLGVVKPCVSQGHRGKGKNVRGKKEDTRRKSYDF